MEICFSPKDEVTGAWKEEAEEIEDEASKEFEIHAPDPFQSQRKRMTGKQDDGSLALLDVDEFERTALHARLQSSGHECSKFSNVNEVLAALRSGLRFELLLAVLRDRSLLDGLFAACLVLGIPVLVVVPNGQWELLSSQGRALESNGVVSADMSRMTDAGLNVLIRALSQRKMPVTVAARAPEKVAWNGYHFHPGSRHVRYSGHEIRLQLRQFELALHLFRNLGSVVERDWLWGTLWKDSASGERKRALDVCISNIRKKLELNGEHGFLLRTVYAQGYQLVEVQRSQLSATDAQQSDN